MARYWRAVFSAPLADRSAISSRGLILASGTFNRTGGQTRNHIARLDPTTGLADSFEPNAESNVLAIAIQGDGKILAGGDFNGANSIGGQTRNRIARLDATTGLADSSFDPNANSTVRSIVVHADGKILAGGQFTTLSPNGGAAVTRNRIARLNPDGTLDMAFNPNANGVIDAIAMQPDGKILVGGGFTSVGGQARNYIARLDANSGVTDSFDPNANSPISSIALQANGKILVGGLFSSIGGQARNHIARLDPITGLADSFDP